MLGQTICRILLELSNSKLPNMQPETKQKDMLQEIFKDKPELLEEPAVKALIEYVKVQHQRNCDIASRYQMEYSDIILKCMNSDVFVIDGIPSKTVIEAILKNDCEKNL